TGAPRTGERSDSATAAPTMAPPAGTPAGPAARVPLARTQGTATGAAVAAPTRTRRRYGKPVAALLAVVIVLALVLGGGYLATRQLYFIGTDSHGIVTIYRGLPYDLPAGIHLYETFYVSGVPATAVPADRRPSLLN